MAKLPIDVSYSCDCTQSCRFRFLSPDFEASDFRDIAWLENIRFDLTKKFALIWIYLSVTF